MQFWVGFYEMKQGSASEQFSSLLLSSMYAALLILNF